MFNSSIWPPLLYPPYPDPPPSLHIAEAVEEPFPPMVLPQPVSTTTVSVAQNPDVIPNTTTYIAPAVTQLEINNFFRIVTVGNGL